MRQLASVTVVVGLLLVTASVGAEPAALAPPPQRLELDDLAKDSKTVEISEDVLRDALVTTNPDVVMFSTALDLGNGAAAIAWSECDRVRCRGWVATLIGGSEHPKLVNKRALPAPARVFADHGFDFDEPAFVDLDGDGVSEIVVSYTATEPPRRGLGSIDRTYLAVYSPTDLALIFSHELWRKGAPSEDACRWALDRSGDRLIAGAECNVLTCLQDPPEGHCKPTRKILETWRRARGQSHYRRVATKAMTRGP